MSRSYFLRSRRFFHDWKISALSRPDGQTAGVVGPTARASGVACDVRMDHPFGLYDFIRSRYRWRRAGMFIPEPMIRRLESQRSIDFLMELFKPNAKGEILRPLGAAKAAHGSFHGRGMRGEIITW